MKRVLILVLLGLVISTSAFAQEYTANTWASFASVTNQAQTTFTFPTKSRTITIMNGSTNVVCISIFGNTTNPNSIGQDCNDATNLNRSNGDNRIFRMPGSQWITLNNIVAQGINLRAAGATASPVSVIVNY